MVLKTSISCLSRFPFPTLHLVSSLSIICVCPCIRLTQPPPPQSNLSVYKYNSSEYFLQNIHYWSTIGSISVSGKTLHFNCTWHYFTSAFEQTAWIGSRLVVYVCAETQHVVSRNRSSKYLWLNLSFPRISMGKQHNKHRRLREILQNISMLLSCCTVCVPMCVKSWERVLLSEVHCGAVNAEVVLLDQDRCFCRRHKLLVRKSLSRRIDGVITVSIRWNLTPLVHSNWCCHSKQSVTKSLMDLQSKHV